MGDQQTAATLNHYNGILPIRTPIVPDSKPSTARIYLYARATDFPSGVPSVGAGSLTGLTIRASMAVVSTKWIMYALGWAASSQKLVSSPHDTRYKSANASIAFNFFVQFTFYCACYCIIVVAANAYLVKLRLGAGDTIDARTIVGLAFGALFGLFSVTMTTTALRFVFQNITNVDLFRKNQTFRLAVRVPTGTRSTDRFSTITYPLSFPGEDSRAPGTAHSNGVDQSDGAGSVATNRMVARDQRARRTFAILQTQSGENPWHIGYLKNFKSVMGESVFEWLLPLRHSPCTHHDSMVSDYEFGPLVEELKRRYGLVEGDAEKSANETTSS